MQNGTGRPLGGLFLLLATILISCQSSKPRNEIVQPTPTQNDKLLFLGKPLEVSENKADKALCDEILGKIKDREADYEVWGIAAASQKTGKLVCGVEQHRLLSPASLEKLVTAAVALEKLGPDFIWETKIASAKPIAGDVLDGDLVLLGGGAPDFDSSELDLLAKAVRDAGIKRIAGDIVGDDSHFKGDQYGDGWVWNETQWYYGAGASALSYSGNEVKLNVSGGKPSDETGMLELSGSLKPNDGLEAIGVRRKFGTNEVYVWGRGSALSARIAVADPARFAAEILREKLQMLGIEIDGKAVSRDWTNSDSDAYKEVIAVQKSRPLKQIVREMNKNSVNLSAELLLRTLGKKFGDTAPDADPKITYLRGDDIAGAAVVEKWLSERRLADEGIAIHDGSGLSRLTRVSVETLVKLLMNQANTDKQGAFFDSLPKAGVDGTLEKRLQALRGRVSAKTGTMLYTNALAGYIDANGDTISFAIIGNDLTGSEEATKTIDEITSILSRRPGK
ncbi:MAG: D-alanyl-D-alanine carboxypeptidase/D-alanyl-D-alanine-endopeptidase [Pyrinomonadaceae bacterium]